MGALTLLVAGSADAHTYSSYATSYCLHGITASGVYTHPGVVAHNFWPAGTRIRLVGRTFHGRRNFVVRDTGPALADGHFDIWANSCSTSIAWGKRSIRYRVNR